MGYLFPDAPDLVPGAIVLVSTSMAPLGSDSSGGKKDSEPYSGKVTIAQRW